MDQAEKGGIYIKKLVFPGSAFEAVFLAFYQKIDSIGRLFQLAAYPHENADGMFEVSIHV
jgi:hypothetical protein